MNTICRMNGRQCHRLTGLSLLHCRPFFDCCLFYNVTPFLNMDISLYPFFSLQVCSPLATEMILSINLRSNECISVPSTSSPALKSIQLGLFLYRLVFVDIFIVGMNVPNGVPRPVVNNTIWQPAAAKAVDATRSLPGADNKFRPFVRRRSP